jgi:hypothetical protein
MLQMTESTWVYGEEEYRSAIADIRGRYLQFHARTDRPPRFLLNDTVRYWRTLCVDFQGKMIDRNDVGWEYETRSFVCHESFSIGGVLPLLCSVGTPLDNLPAELAQWFVETPMDRVVRACEFAERPDLVDSFASPYQDFVSILKDRRQELQDIGPGGRENNSVWQDAKVIEDRFQTAIEELFFSRCLEPMARRYLIF